jgi:alkane 1-monooxygenase
MSMSTTQSSAFASSGDGTWRDGKRYAWMLGLLVPLLPFVGWLLARWTGLGIFWFTGPVVVFGVIPLLDFLVGTDTTNPPDAVVQQLENDRYYRYCTYAFLPLQYASLLLSCVLWSRGHLSIAANIGLALSVGCVGGIAIACAHELGHKLGSFERWLSKIALAQTGYGHFLIEHNRGHHVNVATPEDPASSRFGESFYAFWPRTVSGSFRSGVKIEKQRLEKLGQSFWTLRNDVLNAWLLSVVLFAALLVVFGLRIAPYLALQAVLGFSLLEVVNYLEHYGLLRQKGADGRYERCRPSHSWNSNQIVSNVFLYHLQRHSDHHAFPTRRYQALRNFDDAPNLPSGYATMIVIALFPPLWRHVMDERVLLHYGGDLSKVNVGPSRQGGSRVSAEAGLGADQPAGVRGAPTRRFRCPGCAYVYDERAGHEREGLPAGTRWASVPANWHCPACGVRDKADFEAVDSALAGQAAGGVVKS